MRSARTRRRAFLRASRSAGSAGWPASRSTWTGGARHRRSCWAVRYSSGWRSCWRWSCPASPPPAERKSWHTLARTFTDGVRLVRGRAMLVTFLGVSVFYGLSARRSTVCGHGTCWTSGCQGWARWSRWRGSASSARCHCCSRWAPPSWSSAAWTRPTGSRSCARCNGYPPGPCWRSSASRWRDASAWRWRRCWLSRWCAAPAARCSWRGSARRSKVRATVFSMASQVDAISQVARRPVLVSSAGVVDPRRAGASGLVLSPVLLLTRARCAASGRRTPLAAPVSLDS